MPKEDVLSAQSPAAPTMQPTMPFTPIRTKLVHLMPDADMNTHFIWVKCRHIEEVSGYNRRGGLRKLNGSATPLG